MGWVQEFGPSSPNLAIKGFQSGATCFLLFPVWSSFILTLFPLQRHVTLPVFFCFRARNSCSTEQAEEPQELLERNVRGGCMAGPRDVPCGAMGTGDKQKHHQKGEKLPLHFNCGAEPQQNSPYCTTHLCWKISTGHLGLLSGLWGHLHNIHLPVVSLFPG